MRRGIHRRGALSAVSSYTVGPPQSLPLATQFIDAALPAAGEGLFYLVRPDCPVGNWQTTLGAEPARDAVLP